MILRAGAGLTIRTLPLGQAMANCYVLTAPAAAGWAADDCWVVDPGEAPQDLLDLLEANKLNVRRIVLTHGHGDHIGGCGEVKALFPRALLTVPAADANMLESPMANLSGFFGMPITAPPAQELLQPDQTLSMGELSWRVLDLAGHSPGGSGYYCKQAEVALTGDALFAGSVGRTDLPGGDHQRLLANIQRHLLSLPDATRILPGHGPPSTIGAQRRDNPFLQF
jgi:glyoxylase-like metal-dependent hydrolase (beta-lactamase superfamily II)